MHPVEPPKRGYGVKQNVLQVDGEVEQDDGRNDDDPGWQCDQMKEAPSASIDNERKPDRGRWKDEAYQQRIENHDPEIAWPANVTTNRCRRGPATSQIAMARKTPPKAPSRIYGSCCNVTSSMTLNKAFHP
jgi:hypothetical protein